MDMYFVPPLSPHHKEVIMVLLALIIAGGHGDKWGTCPVLSPGFKGGTGGQQLFIVVPHVPLIP